MTCSGKKTKNDGFRRMTKKINNNNNRNSITFTNTQRIPRHDVRVNRREKISCARRRNARVGYRCYADRVGFSRRARGVRERVCRPCPDDEDDSEITVRAPHSQPHAWRRRSGACRRRTADPRSRPLAALVRSGRLFFFPPDRTRRSARPS